MKRACESDYCAKWRKTVRAAKRELRVSHTRKCLRVWHVRTAVHCSHELSPLAANCLPLVSSPLVGEPNSLTITFACTTIGVLNTLKNRSRQGTVSCEPRCDPLARDAIFPTRSFPPFRIALSSCSFCGWLILAQVPGTLCTAVADAGWYCTPYTAVGSPLDEWKLLSCLRGSHCNKLLKNGWIEAAPSGRQRCAAASATFSWLQLTDNPIQLRLVRGFLLNRLPVLRHSPRNFFDLHSGFLSLRLLRRLLLCANVSAKLCNVTSSAFFISTNEAFRLWSISASSSCHFSSRRFFCLPRPNSSYRSLFACPWWYPPVASPTCLRFCRALQDSGVVAQVALKSTPAPARLYSGCNICRVDIWRENASPLIKTHSTENNVNVLKMPQFCSYHFRNLSAHARVKARTNCSLISNDLSRRRQIKPLLLRHFLAVLHFTQAASHPDWTRRPTLG